MSWCINAVVPCRVVAVVCLRQLRRRDQVAGDVEKDVTFDWRLRVMMIVVKIE